MYTLSACAEAPLCRAQDIMRLDNSARMNLPGSTSNNWTWRIGGPDVWERLAPEAAALRQLAQTYDRLPEGFKTAAESATTADAEADTAAAAASAV